jgi:hypothetical protein
MYYDTFASCFVRNAKDPWSACVLFAGIQSQTATHIHNKFTIYCKKKYTCHPSEARKDKRHVVNGECALLC